MSHQRLYFGHRITVLDKMGGKGMPKSVKVKIFDEAGLFGGSGKNQPQAAGRIRSFPRINKEIAVSVEILCADVFCQTFFQMQRKDKKAVFSPFTLPHPAIVLVKI